APGLAPGIRPGDPTRDSRSGERRELARMFGSGRYSAGQKWIGVSRPGSDTGADDSPSAHRVGAPPGLDAALGSGPSPSLTQLGQQYANTLTAPTWPCVREALTLHTVAGRKDAAAARRNTARWNTGVMQIMRWSSGG